MAARAPLASVAHGLRSRLTTDNPRSRQVVMKIVKHARENPGEVAEGSLLGLTTETSLEVTNCFPLPLRREDDTDAHQGTHGRATACRSCRTPPPVPLCTFLCRVALAAQVYDDRQILAIIDDRTAFGPALLM